MIAAVPREKLSSNDTRFSSIKKKLQIGWQDRARYCFVFLPSYLFLLSGFFVSFFFGAPGTSGSEKNGFVCVFGQTKRKDKRATE